MKKQLLIVGVLALNLANTNLFAQKKETQKEKVETLNEVVITATKFKSKKENTGKVIYEITQKDIVNNAGKTVIELLNNIPGIEIKGANSNASEPRSTYVRGGRSRQVLVLIDGVPVSDPSLISQEYDLRLLSLNQVESIEILKGASSTLYGSGAATGVINIILKKSLKDAISGTYEVSLGTFDLNVEAKHSLALPRKDVLVVSLGSGGIGVFKLINDGVNTKAELSHQLKDEILDSTKPNHVVNSFAFSSDVFYVAAGEAGIYIIPYISNLSKLDENFYHIDSKPGISINSIGKSEDELVVATTEGVSIYSIDN